MRLQDLSSVDGSRKEVKRVGRGHGSGHGKTSGKGHKGQKARSGGGVRPGFEGGQMPLQRRIPKRGFNNIFRKNIVAINVEDLNVFNDGSVVDESALRDRKIVKNSFDGIKILSRGNLERKLTVKANAFSATARQKIESLGGKAEVV